MARERWTDELQSYAFTLFEISISSRAPFFTLGGPVYGFSSVTMPEVSLEAQTIVDMSDPYPTHYFNNASVAPLTLTRGAMAYDSTFWQWVSRSIRGWDRVERNFILLQFAGMAIGKGGAAPGPEIMEIVRGFGKGWLLHECIPIRYKAGGDLDAKTSDVSLMEIDIQPKKISEFSLDPLMLLEL